MAYLDRTDTFMAYLGEEVYRVGGSVRDELLGRKVKDADYVVRECELHALGTALWGALRDSKLEKTALTPLKLRDGRQAGWRVAARGLGLIEIMLPRTDVSTGPGHRDFEIVIDPKMSLEVDCQRRDFTFNALYVPLGVDPTFSPGMMRGAVRDPTGCGLYDLQHKLIRTTHADSFRDDPLRTLRALRFVATLGYDLSADTAEQMTAHAEAVTGLTLKGVSGTALDELCKLLMGADAPKALRLARDTGVLAVLLPELADMLGFAQGSRYHDLTTDEHTFKALETAVHVNAPLRVRMALLFHDSGKPEAAWVGKDGRQHYYSTKLSVSVPNGCAADGEAYRTVEIETKDHEVVSAALADDALRRLNADRKLREAVVRLCRNHMIGFDKVKSTKVRRMRVEFGDELLKDLFLMRMCDISGKGSSKVSQDAIVKVAEMEKARQEAVEAGVPVSVRDLPISGNDLKQIGYEGAQIGAILRQLLDEIVVQPKLNTKEWLTERAEALK